MKKTIYLVEDDEGIREMLGFLLGSQYELFSFENLQSFKSQIEQLTPDLVLMDIMLPDGNGDEVGMSLKEHERTRHIPVLFMSANMKFELADPQPQHSFISKPFDIKVFQEKVKEMINK